ncbi:MAG: M23 family metallopeptidase [Betaproteobacteria bacterium]|nr:peptidoglycan DD-metalloendopeptidase family protein [Betaproteobacteria bacterium]MDE2424113.1 M23 family metallopeptidase [Betaproteobacteria bacterium]
MKKLNCVLITGMLFLSACSSTLTPAPVSDQSISGQRVGQNTETPPNSAKPKSKRKKHTQAQAKEDVTAIPAEVLAIQWSMPVKHYKTALYHHEHKGLDIEVIEPQNVLAAANGVVSYVGDSLKSYGHMIVVKHNADVLSVYADNQKTLVKEGEQVKKGQVIGRIEPSEATRSAIMHFEIRYRGKPLNPSQILPK